MSDAILLTGNVLNASRCARNNVRVSRRVREVLACPHKSQLALTHMFLFRARFREHVARTQRGGSPRPVAAATRKTIRKRVLPVSRAPSFLSPPPTHTHTHAVETLFHLVSCFLPALSAPFGSSTFLLFHRTTTVRRLCKRDATPCMQLVFFFLIRTYAREERMRGDSVNNRCTRAYTRTRASQSSVSTLVELYL